MILRCIIHSNHSRSINTFIRGPPSVPKSDPYNRRLISTDTRRAFIPTYPLRARAVSRFSFLFLSFDSARRIECSPENESPLFHDKLIRINRSEFRVYDATLLSGITLFETQIDRILCYSPHVIKHLYQTFVTRFTTSYIIIYEIMIKNEETVGDYFPRYIPHCSIGHEPTIGGTNPR